MHNFKYFFFSLALILSVNTNKSMEKTTSSMFFGSIAFIGSIILGKISIDALLKQPKTFPFQDLPVEIFNLVVTSATSSNLPEVASAINALARANTELNNLINSPKYTIELIKHLTQRFKSSEGIVCQLLNTKGAQQYYYLNLSEKGLYSAQFFVEEPKTLLEKLQNPYAVVNHKNADGETILSLLLRRTYFDTYDTHNQQLLKIAQEKIKLLLAYGANPAIGSTLFFAKKLNDPDITTLINNAMNEKEGET